MNVGCTLVDILNKRKGKANEESIYRGGSRGRLQGVCIPPPPSPEMTCGFLIQLVFCKKKMWCIGVEVEQETSAPPPKKYSGSAHDLN